VFETRKSLDEIVKVFLKPDFIIMVREDSSIVQSLLAVNT
jgi:anaerobic ribonucleoside-triphosphate reductase